MKKKIIIPIIIGIVLLSTLGVSVAFFSYLKQGQSESSIKSGDITFHYTEISGVGHGINMVDSFPISDSEGKELTGEGKYFDFRIEANLIQSDMIYTVSVEEIEGSNLPLDAVKIYLTEKEENEEIEINSNIDGLGKVKTLDDYNDLVIYQERILKNTKNYEKNFRVRMWISEDIEYDTDRYINKTGSYRINVNAISNKSMVNANTPVPVITGGTGEVWTTSQPTISIVNTENIAGIKNYEYYVTDNSEDIPDDTTLPTDVTTNQYQVSRIGKNYVYYRAVTQSGEKSAWSNPQVVYYDNTEYTITYNLNGGTQGANPVTSYNVETNTFNLPTPTRTNYTFKGWYTNSSFTGNAVTQIEKGSRGNKNYYAKWISNTLTVTVYSAALDEIYYYDSNNQKVVLGTTDSEGKLENASILSQQSITLYSSIAKDPNNLSNPYSKTFTGVTNNGTIYLMPEGAMYWYGYVKTGVSGVSMSTNFVRVSLNEGGTSARATFTAPSTGSYTKARLRGSTYRSRQSYSASATISASWCLGSSCQSLGIQNSATRTYIDNSINGTNNYVVASLSQGESVGGNSYMDISAVWLE